MFSGCACAIVGAGFGVVAVIAIVIGEGKFFPGVAGFIVIAVNKNFYSAQTSLDWVNSVLGVSAEAPTETPTP